jgi:dienelactone hydrolase
MQFTHDTTSDDVRERLFTLDDVAGALWTPVGPAAPRPLILLGHGGGQHKQAPSVVARARRCVAAGFSAVAIDAPGHGDRPKTERDQQAIAEIRRRRAAGEPVLELIVSYNAALAAEAIPEWQATLDALQKLDEIGPAAPVGYWGVSMGTTIGVPLAAAEPRIAAAVLGLMGGDALAEPAALVTVPVQFLVQWDDELVARETALALFDALGSAEKTLHANPGGHADIPAFEHESALAFLARHLDDQFQGMPTEGVGWAAAEATARR